jgi:hypothetical protein
MRSKRRDLFVVDNHHNFPQGETFAPMLKEAGINPDDWRNHIWTADHRALDEGKGNLTSIWKKFSKTNKSPTAEMLHEHLNGLLRAPRDP